MAKTRDTLHKEVFRTLNEALNAKIGDVPTGTDLTSALSTATALDNYLDEGKDWLCRYAYPVPGRASITSHPIGTRLVQLSALSAYMDTTSLADGSVMWAAYAVTHNNKRLAPVERALLLAGNPDYLFAANGTPHYWYTDGVSDFLGIYPPPAQAQTLVIYGYVFPPSIAAGSQEWNWTSDDLLRLPVLYASLMLALKNFSDKVLADRVTALVQELDMKTGMLWNRLEPYIKQQYCPLQPSFLAMTANVPPSGG